MRRWKMELNTAHLRAQTHRAAAWTAGLLAICLYAEHTGWGHGQRPIRPWLHHAENSEHVARSTERLTEEYQQVLLHLLPVSTCIGIGVCICFRFCCRFRFCCCVCVFVTGGARVMRPQRVLLPILVYLQPYVSGRSVEFEFPVLPSFVASSPSRCTAKGPTGTPVCAQHLACRRSRKTVRRGCKQRTFPWMNARYSSCIFGSRSLES